MSGLSWDQRVMFLSQIVLFIQYVEEKLPNIQFASQKSIFSNFLFINHLTGVTDERIKFVAF